MSSFFYVEVSRPFVPLADLEIFGAFPAFQEIGKSYNNKFRTGCRIVRTDFQNACLIYIYVPHIVIGIWVPLLKTFLLQVPRHRLRATKQQLNQTIKHPGEL